MKRYTSLLSAGLLAATSAAMAAEPENYIKYRQAVMKSIGGHMGASSQIVRGKVPEDAELALHAQALADLNTNLTRLFPQGSDFGETKAKEAIWDDPAKFEQAANAARDATAAFATAVAGGDSAKIAEAHKKVGKSCKGCHEDFRQKDE